MRDRARAVVIGGGVGGCSILYWLARLGWGDVVLYRATGNEVGLETGWREVGSLRLASSEERLEEISRQAGWAKTFGLPLELISAAEAQELFPPMSTEGVLGAAYLPTDGYIDPSQLTFALAEGARRHGAEIATGTRVTAIRAERGRANRVARAVGAITYTQLLNSRGGIESDFTVTRLDKDFLGKEALVAAGEPERRLCCVTLADPRAIALGSEPVRVGGELAGRVTSGGYGYTVDRSIAYAYLPAARAEPGTPVEIEIFGEWVGGQVAAEPLYDPEGLRLRA